MHDVLKTARARLERARATSNEGVHSVTGALEGIAVTVTLVHDKESFGLRLTVQAHVTTHGLKVEGYPGSADKRIFTGDAEFDRQYVLRAAPGDVAVALFDQPSREALLAVKARIECDEQGIRLIKSIEDPSTSLDRIAATKMIDLSVALATRCETVVEKANEAYLERVNETGPASSVAGRDQALERLGARRREEMASFYPIESEHGQGRPMRSSSIAVVVIVVVALAMFVAIAGGVFVLVLR